MGGEFLLDPIDLTIREDTCHVVVWFSRCQIKLRYSEAMYIYWVTIPITMSILEDKLQ